MKTKLIVVIVFTFIFNSLVIPQNDTCGTIIPEWYTTEMALAERNNQLSFTPTEERLYCRISLHIVKKEDMSGGITDNEITLAKQILNTRYNLANVEFVEESRDTIISNYFSIIESEIKASELFTNFERENSLNIYFVPEGNNYGTFSFMSGGQGVVVNNFAATHNSTLAHEIGHYFNLYHTHETKFGIECPSGSNCSESGDLVCDTPADPNLETFVYLILNDCSYDMNHNRQPPIPEDCDNTAYNPQIRNIMSYARVYNCRDYFTNIQRQIIRSRITQTRPYIYKPVINVAIEQRDFYGNTFGQIKLWKGIRFLSLDVANRRSTKLLVNDYETLQAYQGYKEFTNEKYNNWNNYSDVINHQSFYIHDNLIEMIANFKPTYSLIAINNAYPEILDNLNQKIRFYDPWLIDFPDSKGVKNRGMGALPYEYESPFNIYKHPVYKGVFLDQEISSSSPYYSVQAISPQTFTLSQTGRAHTFYFQNWSANTVGSNPGAIFQNANSLSTGVVFKFDGAVVSANMKGTQLSSESNAFKPNGQNKIVRISNGRMYQVYESIRKRT